MLLDFKVHSQMKQTIAIHILPNITKSKENHTMKFGKLIEYSVRNNFLEKSYTRCGGETKPNLFQKSKIEHISR